ncbi:NACHT, LRR and PYD domains-containing protein 3-like [Heterodontus francisci]|uniref:NACHT, LRR and PYD domains-containing protein 3-like n=1 Tax=Heterodontus francisci TaxID=7792 RepID=UPI00355C9B61
MDFITDAVRLDDGACGVIEPFMTNTLSAGAQSATYSVSSVHKTSTGFSIDTAMVGGQCKCFLMVIAGAILWLRAQVDLWDSIQDKYYIPPAEENNTDLVLLPDQQKGIVDIAKMEGQCKERLLLIVRAILRLGALRDLWDARRVKYYIPPSDDNMTNICLRSDEYKCTNSLRPFAAQEEKASASTAAKDIRDKIVLPVVIIAEFLGRFQTGIMGTCSWIKQIYLHLKASADTAAKHIQVNIVLSVADISAFLVALLVGILGTCHWIQKTYVHRKDVALLHKIVLQKQTIKLEVPYTGGKKMSRTCLTIGNYTDIMIVHSLREPQLVESDLKALGRKPEEIQVKNIDNALEYVQLDQLLESKDTSTDRTRTTVVFGAPGIGKSTIIQKIIHDWARVKIYHQFKFAFPFKFTQLNLIKVPTNLSTLIVNSYPYFENELEQLWKEPRKILFIFDDLDEFEQTIDFTDVEKNNAPQSQCVDPEYCCLVSDIVRCLIQGELLKGCSVLITSRPWKLESLGNANIHRRIKILGFNSEQMKQYFDRCFGDPQFAKQVTEYIEQNDTLGTMCYNPLFCSVLCSLVESQRTAGKQGRPLQLIPSTRMYSAYVANLLNRCGSDIENTRNKLLKLGGLAYQGIRKQTVVFETDMFNKLELERSNFITAFMMEIRDNDLQSIAYKFPHTVMQDFVAALLKSLHTTPNGLAPLLDEGYTCIDDRFNSFTRFLVGLCSRNSTDQLESKLGKFPAEASKPVWDWLTRNVKTRAQNLDDGRSQGKFLNILHSFAEFEDRNLMAATLAQIKKIKFTKCPLKPFDCVVLSTAFMNLEII